jgi:hypothetical protein
VTYQLNEWRNDQWSDAMESLDSENQSLWKMTKRVTRVPTPSPPLQVPGRLALSDSEKAETLADSLEAQFQIDPSDPAFTEMVDEAMRAYEYAPSSEPTLNVLSGVLQAIKGLKVDTSAGPNCIPKRVLRHFPKRDHLSYKSA